MKGRGIIFIKGEVREGGGREERREGWLRKGRRGRVVRVMDAVERDIMREIKEGRKCMCMCVKERSRCVLNSGICN